MIMDPISARYAFVVPRFGEGIAGGAETLTAELASRLKARGNKVEVFTTCARDNRSWANEYPPGDALEFGVPVKRFAVDERDLEVWIPKQISISEGMNLPLEDQLQWMAHGVNSAGLYRHIAEHAQNFDALFFAPYLFATTFWGSLICPQRSYLIPCLHNEHYAYTDVVQSMFRQVGGALFNAEPERELAQRLYGEVRGGEVGMGFDPPSADEAAGLKPYFAERFPYVLYVGRKETGKNVQLLIDCFISFKAQGLGPKNLCLVVAGGGSFEDLHRPQALRRGDVIDLNHVSETDKKRLITHAAMLCQPSTNESFSIVIMEAWQLGTPVLVHADCAVTRHHATESGGGLYFGSEADFCGVLKRLLEDASLCKSLAEAGRKYVLDRYSWRAVLERFDGVMNELLG